MWSKLKHLNVLPLLGIIKDPNLHPVIPAMVCPWVENGALTAYLERSNDLMIKRRFVLVSVHPLLWLGLAEKWFSRSMMWPMAYDIVGNHLHSMFPLLDNPFGSALSARCSW